MAYNPGRVDLLGDAVKGMQLAIGLEELSSKRKVAATEELDTSIATKSTRPEGMSTEIEGMNVNLGEKPVFNANDYITGLEASGDPKLVAKAQEYKKNFADIASTRETTRKTKLANDLTSQVNALSTMQTTIDMADDDPEAAAKYFTQANIDEGDDKESAQQITPLGNGKYQFIGTDDKGAPVSMVWDRARLVETRADANTRLTQMNENARNEARLAAQSAKDKKDRELMGVVSTKFGDMKRLDLVTEYTKLHKELDDDAFNLLEIRAAAKDAPPETKAEYERQKADRQGAYDKFLKWSQNVYEADMSGLVHGTAPVHWFGEEMPPAWLIRGKAVFSNKTGKWKISDGSGYINPTPEQQKIIDKKSK